jgi:hypothetical protein
MRRNYGNLAGTKTVKRPGTIALDVKLLDKLAMHGFTDFAPVGNMLSQWKW